MIKFAAENFGYETHVGTTREERLHAIGSGHGVLRSLAGGKKERCPAGEAPFQPNKTKKRFSFHRHLRPMRGSARTWHGEAGMQKYNFSVFGGRENKFFCSSPLFAWKGRDERSCFFKINVR